MGSGLSAALLHPKRIFFSILNLDSKVLTNANASVTGEAHAGNMNTRKFQNVSE